MLLSVLDWLLIGLFFVVWLVIGIIAVKKAGRNSSEFFLSGRSMPWWLLGVSMVATTFSTDTPNLVTDIVRNNGVAGNWVWWAFLLTGMLTVFVYARLWRRSGIMTDLEFYELRYSGRMAAFLRGFRALYLGIFFNVMIMASVCLAAIKIGGIMLGLTPVQTIILASIITVIYSMLGGLRGIIWTDFIQFAFAMTGALIAAFVALGRPEVGGLAQLISSPALAGKLDLLPDFSDKAVLVPVLIIPLAVQWWSVWYPGSEPGGGGYIAQRMLAARDEKQAQASTLFFNAAHYALRPWPWIIVALCSLLVFPDLETLKAAFPHVYPDIVKNDLAYPAMLTFLPRGILGLVIASLIAAFMSTISTHLNWGSSYIVHDFYKRFIDPQADEKKLVLVGRLSTAGLMVIAGIFALLLSNALQAFNILLQIGAGTGLIFILRWFWWRINAASEVAAMVISFVIAVYFQLLHDKTGLPALADWHKLILGVAVTTAGWLIVAFLTRPTDDKVLKIFYEKIRPSGPGWTRIKAATGTVPVSDGSSLPFGILAMFLGCTAVYSVLFATGSWIYGNIFSAIILTTAALSSITGLALLWQKQKI